MLTNPTRPNAHLRKLPTERFGAKHGRTGFRCNFAFHGEWNNRQYSTKQIEAYAVEEKDGWLVITVIVKFF